MSRDFGLPGVPLRPGEHLCACYVGADERDAVLVPFIEAALRDGDRCVVAAVEPAALLARLDPELDAVGCVAGRQLVVGPPAAARDGRFRPDRMAELLQEEADAAARDGEEVVRIAAEVPWSEGHGVDRRGLIEFEAWAHRFAALYGLVLLSFYDLGHLGGGVLLDLVRTQPTVLVGSVPLDNPHHVAPAELAGVLP